MKIKFSFLKILAEFEQSILKDREEMMEIFTLAQLATISLKDHCRGDLIKSFSVMVDSCGVLQHIPRMSFLQLPVMIKILLYGDVINSFGRQL